MAIETELNLNFSSLLKASQNKFMKEREKRSLKAREISVILRFMKDNEDVFTENSMESQLQELANYLRSVDEENGSEASKANTGTGR